MKKFLIGVGIFLVLLTVFIVAMLWYGSAAIKPYAEEMLQRWNDDQIDVIFQNAAEEFRRDVPIDSFRDFLDYRRLALGKFVAAGAVTATSRQAEGGQSTAEITLNLQFEKGETEGIFMFVERGEQWRLLKLVIPVPAELEPEPQTDRLEAEAQRFMELYSAGSQAALYDSFAPELKDVYAAETLDQQIGRLLTVHGAITSAELLSSEIDDENYHRMVYQVNFERGQGTVSLKYFWRQGRWDILGFNIAPE